MNDYLIRLPFRNHGIQMIFNLALRAPKLKTHEKVTQNMNIKFLLKYCFYRYQSFSPVVGLLNKDCTGLSLGKENILEV